MCSIKNTRWFTQKTRICKKIIDFGQMFYFEFNVWYYLSWSALLLDLHIFMFMLLYSLLELGFVPPSATTFQPTFHWLAGFCPLGIDFLLLLPPFSIFNCHFPDWHFWTFVNISCSFRWHKDILKQIFKELNNCGLLGNIIIDSQQ